MLETFLYKERAKDSLEHKQFEEVTDLAERLSLPIETHLKQPVENGMVYGHMPSGDLKRMVDMAKEAYEYSLEEVNFGGKNSVERCRRKIELEEARQVEKLTPGEVMIVFSPIPDDVLAGKTTLFGYRRDLARTMVRTYYRLEDEVLSTTISLEKSNKAALKKSAEGVGMELPQSMQSEDILGTRHVFETSLDDYQKLPDRIRYGYDRSLYDQTGKVFYAGNSLTSSQESISFINQNIDILAEHMATVNDIESLFDGEKTKTMLEELRKRTAAALDERLHGGDIVSIYDEVVYDRLEKGNYGGECAIGAGGDREKMGLGAGEFRQWRRGECRVCLDECLVGECNVCMSCEKADNKGVDLKKIHKKAVEALAKRRRPQSEIIPFKKGKELNENQKVRLMCKELGAHAVVKTDILLGSAKKMIIHALTGEVLKTF